MWWVFDSLKSNDRKDNKNDHLMTTPHEILQSHFPDLAKDRGRKPVPRETPHGDAGCQAGDRKSQNEKEWGFLHKNPLVSQSYYGGFQAATMKFGHDVRHGNLLLALRAPISRPLPQHRVTDGGAAVLARLALPVIYKQPLLEIARLAVGVEEIPQCRAAFEDRC